MPTFQGCRPDSLKPRPRLPAAVYYYDFLLVSCLANNETKRQPPYYIGSAALLLFSVSHMVCAYPGKSSMVKYFLKYFIKTK